MQLPELNLDRQIVKPSGEDTSPSAVNSGAGQQDPTNYQFAGNSNSAFEVNTNTQNISGDKVRTGAIESTRFARTAGVFSTNGTQIDLNNGVIKAVQFAIDAAGNAYFKGDISGASGTFSGNISVGSGNSIFRVQTGVGMWLGNATFGSAPFRVDMNGNATATSLTITGYIATGGAANDVNTYATTISGGKIRTGSIESTGYTYISGVYSSVGMQINLDNGQIRSPNFAVDSSGNAYFAGNLSAAQLTSGTLSVGGVSQTAAILITRQTSSGDPGNNSRIMWTGGGSRIWTDSVDDMGLNAIGGQFYIYCNSEQVALFQSSTNRTIFYKNAGVDGTYFYYNSGSTESLYGGNVGRMEYNAASEHYLNVGGNLRFRVSNGGATIYGTAGLYMPNSHIIDHGLVTSTLPAVSGTLKNAIVPTPEGFVALNCIEAPDVWFMDFCDDMDKVDPKFMEVTEPPYHYIPCVGLGYQIWGKRKGFANTRFQKKTGKEFIANERFLNMSKPINNL